MTRYYSTKETAEKLGIAASTVRLICKRSKIGRVVAKTRMLTPAEVARVKADIRGKATRLKVANQ